MPLARSTASRSRSSVGLLQTVLHRHRSFRWVAAFGAAIAAFAALNTNPPTSGGVAGQQETKTLLAQEKIAARLPTATRGVPVPTDSEVLTPGDYVDVHAIRTGMTVAANVLVVEVNSDNTVIAVPVGHVDVVVESLADKGVMLVLVPVETG